MFPLRHGLDRWILPSLLRKELLKQSVSVLCLFAIIHPAVAKPASHKAVERIGDVIITRNADGSIETHDASGPTTVHSEGDGAGAAPRTKHGHATPSSNVHATKSNTHKVVSTDTAHAAHSGHSAPTALKAPAAGALHSAPTALKALAPHKAPAATTAHKAPGAGQTVRSAPTSDNKNTPSMPAVSSQPQPHHIIASQRKTTNGRTGTGVVPFMDAPADGHK